MVFPIRAKHARTRLGSDQHPIIEPAPGRYVKARSNRTYRRSR